MYLLFSFSSFCLQARIDTLVKFIFFCHHDKPRKMLSLLLSLCLSTTRTERFVEMPAYKRMYRYFSMTGNN